MQRPRPVTILAVLTLLLSASNLFTGILLLSGKVPLEQLVGQMPDLGELQGDFQRTMVVIIFLFSVLGLAVGLGLLGMKNWARSITRGLAVLGLLGGLVQMIQSFVSKDAVHFLFYALIGGGYYGAFWYLGRADVRAAFGMPRAPGSEPQPPITPGPGSAG
ncbi:MAG TPA: hypothetical protein VL099_12135 [Candidatus Binatia bacterium]|nr:hypothetical protein [Candidatus Binatia bacterium]